MTFGLVGRKLGHSFSAKYFNDKFLKEGLDCRYVNFEIPSIDVLPALLQGIPDLKGFNVTIPYKEAIKPYLQQLTPAAQEVGAVNTVKITANGLIGHNTDLEGFEKALSLLLGNAAVRKALILGTGGASKAVAAALKRRGTEFQFVSRSKECLHYADLTPELIAENDLIVNATPLGTWPDVESKPDIPYSALSKRHFCLDLVYNPAETAFMKASAENGTAVSNGLTMLHAQADAAWQFWNDHVTYP